MFPIFNKTWNYCAEGAYNYSGEPIFVASVCTSSLSDFVLNALQHPKMSFKSCDFRKFRQIKRTILPGFGFLDTCRHRNWMQLSTQNDVSLFNFSQTQNQPSTPNHEKQRCHKNPKWTVPCKIKIFCYDFEFRKMYRVHSTTQNQRYFYVISDVTRYFWEPFLDQKLCNL